MCSHLSGERWARVSTCPNLPKSKSSAHTQQHSSGFILHSSHEFFNRRFSCFSHCRLSPEADRQRRSPPIRGRPPERGPFDTLGPARAAEMAKKWIRFFQCRVRKFPSRRYSSLTSAVRLERMIRPLAGHIPPGETAQLGVHDRRQLIEGRMVSAAPCLQQFRCLFRRSRIHISAHGTLTLGRHRGKTLRACSGFRGPLALFQLKENKRDYSIRKKIQNIDIGRGRVGGCARTGVDRLTHCARPGEPGSAGCTLDWRLVRHGGSKGGRRPSQPKSKKKEFRL
jgi:hypothetical protein